MKKNMHTDKVSCKEQ